MDHESRASGEQQYRCDRNHHNKPRSIRAEKTGIKVIVVGLGLGGLAAAIECYRNGHDVIALEKNDEIRGVGEFNQSACKGYTRVGRSDPSRRRLHLDHVQWGARGLSMGRWRRR